MSLSSKSIYLALRALSTKFQPLIKTKILTNEEVFFALSLSVVVFIMLINVKMPTIVGILTVICMINFVLNWVEHEKSFITLGPACLSVTSQRLCPLLKAITILYLLSVD